MRHAAIAGLLAGAVVLCMGATSSRLLWQGSSGGYLIQWSTANLTAKLGGKTVLDLAVWVKNHWITILKNPHDQYYDLEYAYNLLSVVGPIVSTEEFNGCDCGGAHPSENKHFKAFNLTKSTVNKPVPALLTDWFAPNDILKAFLNDPIMKKALPPDSSVASLREFIDTAEYQPITIDKQDSCDFTIGRDVLENFAFYDYDGQSVSVRVSLPYYAQSCRGQMIQVGIVLPVPSVLRQSLENAKAHRSGFLMKGRPVIGGPDKETSLMFSEPHIKVPTQ